MQTVTADTGVFQESRKEREKLTRLLVRDGVTASDWFHDQMDLLFESPTGIPEYGEVSNADDLRDSEAVIRSLRRLDWAFTDENTRFLSHDIHPYPAKFIPQIPWHLIARLSLRGELILDPFGGSGSTALEAIRLGRRAVSIDANPVGTLIGRVKTTRADSAVLTDIKAIRTVLETRLSTLPNSAEELTKEFASFVPDIPNRDRWFPPTSCGELALIRACILSADSAAARNIASLALSRCVLKASFQDSETRYASKPREIPRGFTILRFLHDLDLIFRKVVSTAPDLQYGVVEFVTADTRSLDGATLTDNSIDLVVTSPPYGNANDYHLYHRFRLMWLGYDPKELARVEIGSHLRHQKEGSGFEEFVAEMRPCIETIARVLKPGRYAALVIGDSVYKGKSYDGCKALGQLGTEASLEVVGSLSRPIHGTKRSFVAAGRRAQSESILLLRKPPKKCTIQLRPPIYRMWAYESNLRLREAGVLLGLRRQPTSGSNKLVCDPYKITRARRLAFTSSILFQHGPEERTWQAILENGLAGDKSCRKDPKYVTHGLHPYKGKFYPQLAKSLINLAGVRDGASVLDPFCGSGTTLLECRLNGLQAFGCDLNPLAAKIAHAKVGILDISPHVVLDAADTIDSKLIGADRAFRNEVDQFQSEAVEEIERWFAKPVVHKLNHTLKVIRSVSAGVLRDFFEVVLSSVVRQVSHQDPADLRIRRRKDPLEDADVITLFRQRLAVQIERLEKFWGVRGYSPYPFYKATVAEGDGRLLATFQSLGLPHESVDMILTSPPYATALPYIDTDRLSLLILFGMTSSRRRPLEESLSGSREISNDNRNKLERQIEYSVGTALPKDITDFIRSLYITNVEREVGFRRRNLPSLLLRFFKDMQRVLSNCKLSLAKGGQAMIVIGDNTTMVDGRVRRIPTTDLLAELCEDQGLTCVERIPITVTTENLRHIRHSIKQNTVLRLRRR